MKTRIQGDGQSSLTVTAQGITIWLPFQVFGDTWASLKASLVAAIGQRRFISFTPRVMTERALDPDAPRWKRSVVDVVSWMLFWLKVPGDHELVRLWHVIDWPAINQLAGEAYRNAHGGRPAWAPAQLLAMLILMFLYNVAYETTLVARVSENIVWCWFCGFGLFGPFPKHDAFYELRDRLGVAKFEALLTLVVQACLEADLIANELVHFDLTAVDAAAHRWSPYERAVILSRALIRYLELQQAAQTPGVPLSPALRQLAAEVAVECLPHKSLKTIAPERIVESVEHWEQEAADSEPVWKTTSTAIVAQLQAAAEAAEEEPVSLASAGAEVRTWLKGVAQQVLQQLPHARGDGTARVGRTTSYTWFCGYLMGFMVDGLRQVITAVAWGAGNCKQAQLFQPALTAHQERLGNPQAVAADSAFDETHIHSELDDASITGHITSRRHTPPRAGGYGTDRVTWEEGAAHPRCPSGEPLHVKSQSTHGICVFEGTGCQDCELYSRCHPTGEGEPKHFRLTPAVHQRWQENRAHNQTEAYQQAQRARFATEGRFGLAKTNHHGARAPYRSDAMNHIAALLIAIVMNYRILARHMQ